MTPLSALAAPATATVHIKDGWPVGSLRPVLQAEHE